MIPGLLDHLFVLLVLVVLFPFVGWWAYRRFLERLSREGGRALVREYQHTILWLIGLGAATLALWLASGRSLAALGLAAPREGRASEFTFSIAAGALAALILRPLAAGFSRKAAAGLRRQMAKLEAFLPKTVEQLCWGLIVSLFAGLCEEIAYRGYLIPYFRFWLPQWPALIAAAVLFGLAHIYQGLGGTLMTAILGLAFGYIYVETSSLALPIVLHAAVDISAMVTAWLVLRPRAEASA
ncbi:MAG: CPBP family intramembrane metalloprotease [Sphingomonadaceae bacterium]|nr:CPBP family intramembrane metalloprotease [Sphingomonadaceae bacterium]